MGKQWQTFWGKWGSKITADGDCCHEMKRCLLLGRQAMTNLDSILKSRDITLPTKFCLVKAMIFPVVVYECESWTIKTAESWRIDAFELWCWRRFLRVPWTARRANLSILNEINPKCSLEGLMLKLKLQYFATWFQELTYFIIPRTWKQPRCPSDDEWIGKLWYIYTMEYYPAIKKNTFELVLMRWMKLEPIIQREVSQKEKHQYSILVHIYGI